MKQKKIQPIALTITAFGFGVMLTWFFPPVVTVVLETIILILCGLVFLTKKCCPLGK